MSHVHAVGAALLLVLGAVSGVEASGPAGARPGQRAGAAKAPATAATPTAATAAKTATTPTPTAATDFHVQKLPAIHAVVLPMKGSYGQHPAAFERVDAFLSSHRLSRATPLFARYFNDPSLGEANLVWEVGAAVPADAKAEPPFEIKDIPAGPAVVHVHRGSYDELAAKWAALLHWTTGHHHQPSGPTMQIFHTLMPPEVELRLPVKK